MPRKADARLEGRILDAAYGLLSARGERALTMRAVASACGTTTPTLYERFSNKEDLLSLLRRRARLNLFSAIKSSRNPEQVCRRVLDFFASWCYACPFESKRLEKYARHYGNRIAFVGVNTDDFSSDAKRYVRRYGLTYTIVREQGRKVLNTWGGLPIPRIFFIDRDGKVIGQMQIEEDLPRFVKRLASEA